MMREVTFQIVMRLDESTGCNEIRYIEERLYGAAKRSLVMTHESVSVGKIMDRKVEGDK
jgi:hypothetical protein